MFVARLSTRATNDDFFRGGRRSPWLLVAFGMLGASLSGVSFVSVPGMVETQQMTYMQMCLGFIPGYILVACVLLPIYYRLRLTSIYTFLQQYLGMSAWRVGAACFIIGDLLGSAVKFCLVCVVLQQFVFDGAGVPLPSGLRFIASVIGIDSVAFGLTQSFCLTVTLLMAAIWLYTRHGGVRTLVITDVLQTVCMLAALVLILFYAYGASACHSINYIIGSMRMFDFNMSSPTFFWRQFLSGIFVVVVMTGLNQNMMQKNLTCRSLPDARKNLLLLSVLFLPVNMLLLLLGALLLDCGLDAHADALLPAFVRHVAGQATVSAYILQATFVLGIASAAFSSADSSLTSLTTSWCIDIAARPDDERLRRRTHFCMAVSIVIVCYVLRLASSASLIDVVYTLVGYTYGPLLALFILAFLHRHRPCCLPLRTVLPACIIAPACCFILTHYITLGYELLLLNAAITLILIQIMHLLTSSPSRHKQILH